MSRANLVVIEDEPYFELSTHPRFIDLTGDVYSRLTVVRYAGVDGRRHFWYCSCFCGNGVRVISDSIRGGNTQSCGCLNSDIASNAKSTHGMSNSVEYAVYMAAKNRCNNKQSPHYDRYGGRDNPIEFQFSNFDEFFECLGHRPSDIHSLDRIDNDLGYCASNCRWATPTEQANNRRSNTNIEFRGRTQTIAQWSRRFNIGQGTLRHRLNDGWSIEDALTTPVRDY